jgi:tetratricopeptide (TPR) repeat protein
MAEQGQPVRRKVALKVLKPGMDTRQVVARFEAERQALALMDHPNIAKVHDGGTTPSGRPYFVMELVRGAPIIEFCDQNQLTPRQRLELFADVCQAVQHAHQKGVIHRDLKPANVLVSRHDTMPIVKVIDFGVAKALGQELTDKTLFTGIAQMVGTPLYMSPEQAGMSDLDIDTRSDVYALGVLLYELLTGTTPFDPARLRAAGYDELRRIIREEEPPRPSTRISTLGQAATTASANRKSDPKQLSRLCRGEVDWIVMKCLEKDRNRRYETANGLAQDVQRYLADEPVQACPPSAGYRFRKFARRNRRALATASVLALAVLLAVGAVAGSLGWTARDRSVRQAKLNLEIEHALDDATRAREQALTLTDNPYRWEAALAEAESGLKRAWGLAAQDETAVEPAVRKRLQALQDALEADETDRRFASRFEEVRLEQTEVNVAISAFKAGVAFPALREAFRRHYGIEFGVTSVGEAVTVVQQRPRPVQDILLAALEVSLDDLPQDDRTARPWLAEVLDAADTGPWRKRAQQALQASDWQAFEEVVEEAVAARQPPSLLVGLSRKTPRDFPICLKVARRVCQAYPGDFWANHDLANFLQYRSSPQYDEAIRFYGAALAIRPGNPADCVNLGNALLAVGDKDGAINAYRAALDGHLDYITAHRCLREALEKKGDLDGIIADLRQTIHLRDNVRDHQALGYLFWRKGLLDEAIAEFTKAIELDANNALARRRRDEVNSRLFRGIAYSGLKQYDKAVADFTRIIELDPKFAMAWNGRAGAYRRLGQWERARYDAAKALDLKPDWCPAQNSVAWMLAACPDAKLRDPKRAVELAEKAVKTEPRRGAFWTTLAVARYQSGDWKGAAPPPRKPLRCSTAPASTGASDKVGSSWPWPSSAWGRPRRHARPTTRVAPGWREIARRSTKFPRWPASCSASARKRRNY